MRPKEVDCDDYFNCVGPFTPYVTGWDVYDPYFAVLFYDNGTEAALTGLNGGTAYIQANIGYEQYYWDGFFCVDEGFDTTSANGQTHIFKGRH